jgi:Mrp family chromosome partitioning ATPase
MNLTADLSQLIDQLEPIARPGGEGRALMVMGASRGAGASTVARELARLAAKRSSRGVWLYDLEFAGNPQSEAARVRGQAFDAGFGRDPFWSIQSGGQPARIIARESAVSNLFVTQLQARSGSVEQVGLRAAPDYWQAVRQSVDLAIIDAPGGSRAPLAMVGDMDGVILVADARMARVDGIQARRQAIEARGGIVAGLILNRTGQQRSAA